MTEIFANDQMCFVSNKENSLCKEKIFAQGGPNACFRATSNENDNACFRATSNENEYFKFGKANQKTYKIVKGWHVQHNSKLINTLPHDKISDWSKLKAFQA